MTGSPVKVEVVETDVGIVLSEVDQPTAAWIWGLDAADTTTESWNDLNS
jgi:hypothetical protein